MKKLVFGLIATVMFGLVGNAQSKLTQEDVRLKLATTTSQFVEDCRGSYKKGMSYDDFIKAILQGGTTGPTFPIPTQEGQALMKSAYNYVSSGTTADEIIKTDNGKVMGDISVIVSNSKTLTEAATKIFGNDIISKTTFGQNIVSNRFACCKWLSDLWNWVWGHRDEIREILCAFWQIGC